MSVFTAKDTEYQDSSARYELPRILYDMLEDAFNQENTNIVSWMPHGRAFKVHNRTEFENKIMPRYFTEKYDSFRYLLEQWGFCRLSRRGSKDRGAYYHCLFVRGRRHLSANLTKKQAVEAMPDFIPAEDEPDLYQLAIDDPIQFEEKKPKAGSSKGDGKMSGRDKKSSKGQGKGQGKQLTKQQKQTASKSNPTQSAAGTVSSKAPDSAATAMTKTATSRPKPVEQKQTEKKGQAKRLKSGQTSIGTDKNRAKSDSGRSKQRTDQTAASSSSLQGAEKLAAISDSDIDGRDSAARLDGDNRERKAENMVNNENCDADDELEGKRRRKKKKKLKRSKPAAEASTMAATTKAIQDDRRHEGLPPRRKKRKVFSAEEQRRRSLGQSLFVPQPEELPTLSLCRYYVPSIHHDPSMSYPPALGMFTGDNSSGSGRQRLD